MESAIIRILLTGPPRSGKTTLVCRLAETLVASGFTVGGFVTREIRHEGDRVGFTVEEIGGGSALLAHVALPEGPRVGRYRVDVAAFEALALPAIRRIKTQGGIAVIDELGQMELYSQKFVDSFLELLDFAIPIVATIHARSHPITDAIKQRQGVQLIEVDRDGVERLYERLLSSISG